VFVHGTPPLVLCYVLLSGVSTSGLCLVEGRALLLLVPSEQEAMLKALDAAKVPMKPIKMNPSKQQPITGALQALLSKDPALKVPPHPVFPPRPHPISYSAGPCLHTTWLMLT